MDIVKVTVLMPVYNGEKYLHEAMESILNQTFNEFEFLIIDDGSADRSLEIIQSYNDTRIKLIKNEKNLGVSATVNKGMKLAQGKYIVRMDCDDISVRERIEKQVQFMDNNYNVGISGTWIKCIGDNFDIHEYLILPKEIKSKLFFSSALAQPSVIIRKELLERNNLEYNVNYSQAEDWDLWYRSSLCFDIANIPEVLLYYRVDKMSASNFYIDNHKFTVGKIMLEHFKDLDVDVTTADLNVCIGISKLGFVDFEKILDRAKILLKQAKENNSMKQKYPNEEFKKVIADIWYELCSRSVYSGVSVFYKYVFSGVGQICQHPIRVIKILIKSIIQYKR